ncbi:MAG: mannonate dehydratase [Bacteroidota bacterium]
MSLEQTWRWFGPQDPITLPEIRQTGVTGVVTALHQIPTGEVWPVDEIRRRKGLIEAANLSWSVAESVPVHEHIKRRTGHHSQYVENYRTTIRNLGQCGVDTVCYNFMPLLDWSRTDLEVQRDDGSTTTRFQAIVFAAFDLCILGRKNAEHDYTEEQLRGAKQLFASLNDSQKDRLLQTILLGFPGSLESYSLKELKTSLQEYAQLTSSDVRENLHTFIKEIVPVAEESGVRLAIHPDDPPWPLLGLPRIVSTEKDIRQILDVSGSVSNGITLCTGSLGAGPANDLVPMANEFAERIQFIHLRNVVISGTYDFTESDHLEGAVDMYGVMKALVLEQKRRLDSGKDDARMPFRPDHGRLMPADRLLASFKKKDVYPGYSLFGRMRGLAELRGLELGVRRSLGL